MAVSKNTRLPQTIGDADPRPGISTFHRRFFVSLHSVGGFADRETPVAYGPRHCGQNRSAAGPCAVGAGVINCMIPAAVSKATICTCRTAKLLCVSATAFKPLFNGTP